MNILADVSIMRELADAAGSHYSDKYFEAERGTKDRAWYGFKMHQAHAVYWALRAKEHNERARSPLYSGDDAVSKAERGAIRAEAKLSDARGKDYYEKSEANRAKWLSL
jgi:hypothetical protein